MFNIIEHLRIDSVMMCITRVVRDIDNHSITYIILLEDLPIFIHFSYSLKTCTMYYYCDIKICTSHHRDKYEAVAMMDTNAILKKNEK